MKCDFIVIHWKPVRGVESVKRREINERRNSGTGAKRGRRFELESVRNASKTLQQ